jgi:phage major head subunit gpT-like protein
MEINAANLDIIFRTASAQFQQTLMDTPTFFNEVATTLPCATQQTTLAFIDRLPQMRKWIGNRVITNAIARSRTINIDPYEQTLGLDKYIVEDDQLNLFYQGGITMQAQAGANLSDLLISDFIRTANVTVGYDGVPVFSASHPINGGIAGGVAANAPTTQSNLYVSTALTYANYQTVRQEMRARVGMDGAPLGLIPDLLMVPPALEGAAKLILESDFLAQTAFGASSNSPQSNVYKGTARILVNPWLADMPNNWWLFDTTKGLKPLVRHLRQDVVFTALMNPTDPNVFLAREFLFGIDARMTASESVWFLSSAGTSEASYTPA